MQCTCKWLCAFIANFVEMEAAFISASVRTLAHEWHFINKNILNQLHFAIWILQCTRKWLYTFIANFLKSETVCFYINSLDDTSVPNNSRYLSDSASWALQCTRQWRCAFWPKFHILETVSVKWVWTRLHQVGSATNSTVSVSPCLIAFNKLRFILSCTWRSQHISMCCVVITPAAPCCILWKPVHLSTTAVDESPGTFFCRATISMTFQMSLKRLLLRLSTTSGNYPADIALNFYVGM